MWCGNGQKCAQAVWLLLIVLVCCHLRPAPIAAQTEIRIWDETIVILPDDRMILQVDGKNYRLPSQADQVPAQPVDQIGAMFFAAAGDLEQLADGQEIKLPTNHAPFIKNNCFVYDEIGLPGFNIPSGLVQADAGYLNGCIVATVSFGPGVKSDRRFLSLEDWNDRHKVSLSASPPKVIIPPIEVTPLSMGQVQELLVVGTAMEGLYFLADRNTGPDVEVLFDMPGPLFGPGTRFMKCDAGYGPPRIFGQACRISAMSEAHGAFISIRIYCPCKQDLEGLIAIDRVVTDRLRGFVR